MSIYQTVSELERSGIPAVLCTLVEAKWSTPRHQGSKMIVFEDGHIEGTIGGGETEKRVIAEALTALKDRKPKFVHYKLVDPSTGDPGICGGQMEFFLDPITPKSTIVIIGAGHVGKQVAFLAKWLGYKVVVSDDREEMCNPQFIPGADEYLVCPMAEISQKIKINQFTYIIITTRGSDIDIEGLPGILDCNPGYIGVIGSKRRWENTKKKINSVKDYSDQLAKVFCPIGLDLSAESPEEIAVSILAEVMLTANGAVGNSLSKH